MAENGFRAFQRAKMSPQDMQLGLTLFVCKNQIKQELFFYEKQMSPPFRNKKNHKIAFSYITRGIIRKIYM